jgi:hypothetical protein
LAYVEEEEPIETYNEPVEEFPGIDIGSELSYDRRYKACCGNEI